MGRFEGKVVFVTGGASGMGLATVKLLAKEGAKVVFGDIQWELAQKVARDIGGSVTPLELNIGSASSVESAIKFTEEKYGGLDYAVNAAAIQGPLGALDDVEPSDFDKVFNIDLAAIAYLLKYEIAALKRRGGGAIVNIASIAGLKPTPFLGIYSAAKAGVISLTQIGAVEAGPHGIRINAIAPGFVDTPLLPKEFDRNWIASVTPNRRCGLPSDIADATLFLLSEDAKQINGTTMPVDGGLIAGHHINPPGY